MYPTVLCEPPSSKKVGGREENWALSRKKTTPTRYHLYVLQSLQTTPGLRGLDGQLDHIHGVVAVAGAFTVRGTDTKRVESRRYPTRVSFSLQLSVGGESARQMVQQTGME